MCDVRASTTCECVCVCVCVCVYVCVCVCVQAAFMGDGLAHSSRFLLNLYLSIYTKGS